MENLRENINSFALPIRLHPADCVVVLSSYSKPIAYGLVLSILSLWLLFGLVRRISASSTPRASSLDLEKPTTPVPDRIKASEKQPGIWTPIDFRRPVAAPYPEWDIQRTRPLPYRPFKYGKYYITMGLRSMKWDEWLELDNHYLKYHENKARRIEERGEKCNRTAPEAFDGAVELLEEL